MGISAFGDKKAVFSVSAGALIGNSIGFFFGFDVSNGLWGFNSALTSVALYSAFGQPLWRALVMAGVTGVVHPVIYMGFCSMGLASFSMPFCIITMVIINLFKK